ncbi:hypothetical protein ABIA03_000034 [Bradyrhizobium yuanmingense]|uniref:Transposase n=1 Tax=Bradyrhizobium yuanmingense TaxID=108015 RepID=A0ABV4G9S7_9BRAD
MIVGREARTFQFKTKFDMGVFVFARFVSKGAN